MNLLDQMVVIRVENVIESAHVLLVVMHPEFDRITPGMVYPEYEATFIPHNPFPIWRKV
jgi:hypothetical protein